MRGGGTQVDFDADGIGGVAVIVDVAGSGAELCWPSGAASGDGLVAAGGRGRWPTVAFRYVTELLGRRSCCGRHLVLVVSPSDGLVVGGVVFEAAVQDADETVAEGSQSGMMRSPAARWVS